MLKEFRGKVAVVTGAASGMGRALARRFAADGMRVVLADIEEPVLSETARALQQQGATVLPYRLDVSKSTEVESLAKKTYDAFGAVHVLCNNAGVAGDAAPAWVQSLDAWQWVLSVNLWGVIHGIHSFVPRMIAGGDSGHVVNTASLGGLSTMPMVSPYHASKFGVVAISECLFYELQQANSKIGASVLCPGLVKTRLADQKRNRPPGQFDPAGSDEYFRALGKLHDQGLEPEVVADCVLQAIQQDQFWILTHSEVDDLVRNHADSILKRRNPIVSAL